MSDEIAERYTGLLQHLRNRLESDDFLRRHRKRAEDFTRNRVLPFVYVILMLINMLKRSLQDELDEFFKVLDGEKVASRQVSKSAFSQARQKLNASAFVELNCEQVNYFYNHFTTATWFGFRLTAIDGTLLDVPDTVENRQAFGVWGAGEQGKGAVKARVSQWFDVLNEVTLDAQIAAKSVGERELALPHFALLRPTDLVLIDRGYPAFWLFARIRQQDAHFCARLDVSKWHIAQDFIRSGDEQQQIVLTPSSQAKRQCRALQLPTTPLRLRLIRVELSTGEVEVLITSLLDDSLFPHSLFQALYHQRWPVEEDYKRLQSRLEVENWSGTSLDAVYQDFHASIFTKNLAAILAQPAQLIVSQAHPSRKHPYKVNMTNLISKLKDTVLFFFTDSFLLPLLNSLWSQMTQTLEPIRPNRSFPRHHKVHPQRFPINYKPTR